MLSSQGHLEAAVDRRWVTRLPPLLAAVGGTLVVGLTFGVFGDRALMEADLSTYLLPVRALLEGTGGLYVDYFDIKPPLTYALLVPWLAVAGPSLLGWWSLYALLLGLMFTGQWLLLRWVLSPWLALYVFASLCLVMVGTGVLEELFFITEVMGLVLVLWGLLAFGRGTPFWAFFGALLVTAAGQVKEIFILAPIALIPLALACPRGKRSGVLGLVAGVATGVAVTVGILGAWGSGVLSAYLEVLGLKRERFPAPTPHDLISASGEHVREILGWLPLIVVFLVGVIVATVMSRRATTKHAPDRSTIWSPKHTSVVLLVAAVSAGFLWQGAPLIRHYAVAVMLPLFLALAALLSWGWHCRVNLRPWPARVVAILLLLGLVPALHHVLWSLGSIRNLSPAGLVSAATSLESEEDLTRFRVIEVATDPEACIQVAYGWSASAYHWYSHREPCARFYVPPLDLSPRLRQEYQQALIDNPPSLIVLDTGYELSTTVSLKEGTPDEVIFPFQAVAERCYEPLESDNVLYRPVGSANETSACIAQQVASEIRR